MPEGDTVWNTARALERALQGDVLTGSDFRVPQFATSDLTGWTVAESASRGKHLLLRLTRDAEALTLHSHLRMDGAWRAFAPGERWSGRPAHLIRVVLTSPRSVAVGYHLHEVALVPTAEEGSLLDHLGPDLLGGDPDADEASAVAQVQAGFWVEDEAVRRLQSEPDRPIGGALLDQRNLAGLGTVLTAEVLFLAGINPATTVGQVGDLRKVVRLARRITRANRGRTTRVTTGDMRRGQHLWVYGRRGPCRRCGTPVEKDTHGAEAFDRVAYWCPSCQPRLAERRAGPIPVS